MKRSAIYFLYVFVFCTSLFFSAVNAFAEVSDKTFSNPNGAAADPCVLRTPAGKIVDYNGRYWLYFTGATPNDHSFVARSTDDFVRWKDEGVVFNGRGTWARNTYWAPEAYEIDGKFYLFFSAQNSDLPWTQEEHFNVGVAVADAPMGPFRLLMNRPIFEPGYPIIDANLFIDDDGTPYLTYSRCCYQHPVESELADLAKKEKWFDKIEESWVYGVKLKPDFTEIDGEPVLLLRPPVKLDDQQAEWESRSVTAREVNRRWTEGSTLFKHGGRYYLMYSANNFAGDYYAVGYATSDKPLGTYTKANNNPVLEKNTQNGGKVRGTGHNNIFFSPDGKEMFCVYHGRTKGDERRLFIDRMEIDADGILKVHGPTTTPQPAPSWIPSKKKSPAGKTPSIHNPIISNRADPWIVRDGDRFIWCFSENDLGVALYVSDSPDRLGEKHVIWSAPKNGPYSKEVWAPELHKLDGLWYVYFAASDGKNENHLAYVLRSKTGDPLGEYEVLDPLYTGDDFQDKTDNRWAIDMTVLEHGGKRYAVWSGWQNTKDEQHLFIAPMENPWTLSAARTKLCENDDFLWERTEEKPESRGLSEGPQVLKWKNRTFIVYSCGASWLPTYKLGMLELIGKNPLNPKSWKKYPEPVFQRTKTVFGQGHACFIAAPTKSEPSRHWIIFHAKRTWQPGWLRDIFIQTFDFNKAGLPEFGSPVQRGVLRPDAPR